MNGHPTEIRCAIYTRKSSAERPGGEFTSLDNQRDYCSAFIASQAGESWTALPSRYDDGGFSGGSLRRPALSRLRSDIAAGLIDVVVVYKIDRLSRSLRDFVNLVAEFDARNVTFVSVTQSFNTSNSMGRLTLNVLLSFAQFERELIGERLREWFAGARQRGLWTSHRPFGYAVRDGRLVIDPTEAEVVRLAYKLYGQLRSHVAVADTLNAAGHRHKGARKFSRAIVTRMIGNKLYNGYHPHRDAADEKCHPAIIGDLAWTQAQNARTQRGRRPLTRREIERGILRGLLYGPGGNLMLHLPVTGRNFKRYRYYVDAAKGRYGPRNGPENRYRALELEEGVIRLIAEMHEIDAAMVRDPAEIVRKIVQRIDITGDLVTVTFMTGLSRQLPIAGRIGSSVNQRL